MFTQFLWELLQLNEPAENGIKTLTGFCQITNRTSRVRLQGGKVLPFKWFEQILLWGPGIAGDVYEPYVGSLVMYMSRTQ